MKQTIKVERNVAVTKIAICGQIRAGKSEISNRLLIYHDFQPFAFATAMKRFAHDAFPWIDREPKPRKLYQQYGELMREIDANIWVRHLEQQVQDFTEFQIGQGATDIRIVVDDLRMQHEYDWARANGFSIVRVTAPDELRIERARKAGDVFSEEDLAHETEQEVAGFAVDWEIVNGGRLSELGTKVDEVVAKVIG